MADKYPQTYRDDVSPSKNPTLKKEHGESFNEAMNQPNSPNDTKGTPSYNVTDDYTDGDNSK